MDYEIIQNTRTSYWEDKGGVPCPNNYSLDKAILKPNKLENAIGENFVLDGVHLNLRNKTGKCWLDILSWSAGGPLCAYTWSNGQLLCSTGAIMHSLNHVEEHFA
jgi:hypothetical protein